MNTLYGSSEWIDSNGARKRVGKLGNVKHSDPSTVYVHWLYFENTTRLFLDTVEAKIE